MKKDCKINGHPATADEAAEFLVRSGGDVEFKVVPRPCPKCKTEEPYKYNGSPNWMNRWTCTKCKRHESR